MLCFLIVRFILFSRKLRLLRSVRQVGVQPYIPNVFTLETTTKGVLEVLEQMDITRYDTK